MTAAVIANTLCWNCNTAYPTDAEQCPKCCATNANIDFESAAAETKDKSQICHNWEWISDWYGDPGVINGTRDCSHYRCTVCGEEDHKSDPPTYEDSF